MAPQVQSTMTAPTTSSANTPALRAPRVVAIAVDDTVDAEEAVQWAVSNVIRAGDVVHLLHVISDPRSSSTPVGSSSAGAQSMPSFVEPQERKKHVERLKAKANTMLQRRFIPILETAKAEFEVCRVSGMAALAVMQHQGLRRCRCGAAAAGLILQQPGLLDMMQWCCTGNADSAAQFTPGKIAVVLWAGTKLGVQARHYSEAQVDLLRETGVKSAAGIGSLLCSHTDHLGASMLLIASHGT
eukprot:jgi/Astpho2/3265/fgenesh1_pg.00053_%23_3_t